MFSKDTTRMASPNSAFLGHRPSARKREDGSSMPKSTDRQSGDRGRRR